MADEPASAVRCSVPQSPSLQYRRGSGSEALEGSRQRLGRQTHLPVPVTCSEPPFGPQCPKSGVRYPPSTPTHLYSIETLPVSPSAHAIVVIPNAGCRGSPLVRDHPPSCAYLLCSCVRHCFSQS